MGSVVRVILEHFIGEFDAELLKLFGHLGETVPHDSVRLIGAIELDQHVTGVAIGMIGRELFAQRVADKDSQLPDELVQHRLAIPRALFDHDQQKLARGGILGH